MNHALAVASRESAFDMVMPFFGRHSTWRVKESLSLAVGKRISRGLFLRLRFAIFVVVVVC